MYILRKNQPINITVEWNACIFSFCSTVSTEWNFSESRNF